MTYVDFGESKRPAILCWLRYLIDFVDKYAHVLLARAVSVYCTSGLLRRFDLDAVEPAGLNRVIGEPAFYDQIRMAVMIVVRRKGS